MLDQSESPGRFLAHLHGGEEAHYLRYCRAAEWIEPLMSPGVTVLDLGCGEHPFRDLIHAEWPDVALCDTGESDLRYPLPLESETFDLVLCMEVLEHIKDRAEDNRADFTASGIRNMLDEAYRVLKPNGRLFLSTPNLACWHSIYRLLMGFHPYFYQPHNRELTWNEVADYLSCAGLEVERCETLDVWNQHNTPQSVIDDLRTRLAAETWDNLRSRGDCLFAIAGRHTC